MPRHGVLLATQTVLVLAVAAIPMLALAATPDPDVDPTVLVEDFTFTPAEVVAFVDQPVTWTIGSDPEQHTVTPTDGAAFDDSGQLFAGDTFTVRFEAPGRYAYLCTLHPFMTGSVTVVAAPTAATATPAGTTSPSVEGSSAPSSAASAATASAAASPAASDPANAGAVSMPVVALLIAMFLVAVLLAVFAALQRRRRA